MQYRDDILEGRFEFKQTGFFYEQLRCAEILMATVITLCCVALVYLLYKIPLSGSASLYSLLVIGIYAAVIIFVTATICSLLSKGRKWSYEATNKYMRIYRKNKVYCYTYGKIKNVSCKPLKLFHIIKRGYICTVETETSKDIFYYIRPDKRDTDTPFDLLLHPPAPQSDNNGQT